MESSSSEREEFEYDVFLSFAGVDTRKAFVDHLYNFFVDSGIRTFRDSEMLHVVGSKIEHECLRTIRQSKISIPIFSRNYASSRWCLLELNQMLECQKNNEQLILPIFYDVTPSEVRDQTGPFEQAFLRYEKISGESIAAVWRSNLREVSDLSGWEMEKDVARGNEGQLVRDIVLFVSQKLRKEENKYATIPVGIQHHTKKMKDLLDIGNNEYVRVIAIHGEKGIGKTTVAKYFYEIFKRNYSYHRFVEDGGEKTKDKSLLQVIDSIPRDRKVLLILDDVTEQSQVDGISGQCFVGSRIVFTTRNEKIRAEHQVGEIKLDRLNDDASLVLFRLHAFQTNPPGESYEAYCRKVVEIAQGLPLNLVTLGGFLYGKTLKGWDDTLKNLNSMQYDEVKGRPVLKYDAGDHWRNPIYSKLANALAGRHKRIS